jgi:hypothetical protein
VALGDEELGTTYTLLNRYLLITKEDLRLPTLFLLDAAGDIVKLYRGRIDAAELVADLAAIDASPVERLRRAFPFAGAFYSTPASNSLLARARARRAGDRRACARRVQAGSAGRSERLHALQPGNALHEGRAEREGACRLRAGDRAQA